MSRLSNFIPRPRVAAWLAFGAVGLATGAVWASGFAQVTTSSAPAAESPAMTKSDAADPITALDDTATAVTPLEFGWDGRWGKVAAPTVMFQVDLSGSQFAAPKSYNVALLLTNKTALLGWATLQLEVEHVVMAPGETCVAGDFDGSKDPKLLNVDNQDAGAYWNGLAGEHVHCFGIAPTTTNPDIASTLLRSATDAAPTVSPSFIATVDRAA